MAEEKRHNLSVEVLEQCVAIAAYGVAMHSRSGEMARIFQAMEYELELARQEDPVVKARRYLENYTRDGGVNAIFSNTECLKAKV